MNDALEIWRRCCRARSFELCCADAHKAGRLAPAPIYLSVGTELVSAITSARLPDWHVFAQHRCHSWYLSYGGCPRALRDELLGLTSGCAGGMGGSASLHWPPNQASGQAPDGARMWGHSGLLGDQVPIATGFALASGQKTLAVLGDAAAEEDYVLASFGFAITKNIPILFLVEDNDLSILTRKCVRRSWSVVDVARGFGLPAYDVDEELLPSVLSLLSRKLPALVNVSVRRHLWHAGSGSDAPLDGDDRDAMALFRDHLVSLGLGAQADEIEAEAAREMAEVWQ